MIDYDKNKWYFLVFSFKGTVIRTMAVRLLIFTLLTVMLAILQDKGYAIPKVNSTLHTLLGTGLSLLLVFRTNSSYDRYWEGRKLLGQIVINSRNLLRAAACYTKPSADGSSGQLVQYVDGYLTGLKQKLRADPNLAEFKNKFKVEEEASKITKFVNPASASLYMISRWIQAQVKKGNLERWQARSLEGYIAALGEQQGGLERIANTPIPFAYAAHTHQFLFLYLITLPFTMVFTYQYYSIPAVFIIAFGLLGVDEAGVEIEDPFGLDDNDLPLESIFNMIINDAKGLAELYGPEIDGASGAGGSDSFTLEVADETKPDDAE